MHANSIYSITMPIYVLYACFTHSEEQQWVEHERKTNETQMLHEKESSFELHFSNLH